MIKIIVKCDKLTIMKKINYDYLTIDKLSQNSLIMINDRLKAFLKRFKVTRYPINCFKLLQEIIDSNTIKIDFMGSEYTKNFDGAVKYYVEENGYCIFLNSRKIGPFDYSPNRRCNFTLAHELGHIFLGHLSVPYELKPEDQRVYEDLEADEFAARLLMPENLVLQCNFITGLTGQFLVTSYDLFKRVNNLKRLDLYKSKPLPTCKICGNTHFSPAAMYCKICGTEVNHFTTRGILRIVYSKLANDTNICQSGHENDRNARYCELCGQPTSFNEILPAWQVEREQYIKSLVRLEYRKKRRR